MTPSSLYPIETKRLVLRRFTPADAEAMFNGWTQDPEVARHMRWTPHRSIEETRAMLQSWVQAYQSAETCHWAITLKESGALIGSIGILREDEPGEDTTAHTPGYCIARPYWNKGYTTEALIAVLQTYIAATGNTHLVCCHALANPASGAVMRKAGFVFHHKGVYHRANGSPAPALYYRFSPATFAQLTPAGGSCSHVPSPSTRLGTPNIKDPS